jgi:hypothetical protein
MFYPEYKNIDTIKNTIKQGLRTLEQMETVFIDLSCKNDI